jgi:hypothetical protein
MGGSRDGKALKTIPISMSHIKQVKSDGRFSKPGVELMAGLADIHQRFP